MQAHSSVTNVCKAVKCLPVNTEKHVEFSLLLFFFNPKLSVRMVIELPQVTLV